MVCQKSDNVYPENCTTFICPKLTRNASFESTGFNLSNDVHKTAVGSMCDSFYFLWMNAFRPAQLSPRVADPRVRPNIFTERPRSINFRQLSAPEYKVIGR